VVLAARDERHFLSSPTNIDRLNGEPVRHLKVGTVLVREHQGTLHQVIVVPGGFSRGEKTYPSLSTIARAITGTS
jgi:hypothetical protein